MPNNMLRVSFVCPRCGAGCEEEALEFAYGALAGETYEVGDLLRFDEGFSFFASALGAADHPGEWVGAGGECGGCGAVLGAEVFVSRGVIVDWRWAKHLE